MAQAEDERLLLNHYNLSSLNPSQWPYDVDEQEVVEALPTVKDKYHRRRTILGRGPSLRNNTSGSQQANGKVNHVQKDETDPLGTSESVVQTLRRRGLPIEEDLKLRNQFLLSSTTFSPSRYLAEVHSDASTDQLLQGLDFLSQSIEKKSASLKVLVESNLERFVRAKSTIDNVYKEMRNHGAETEVVKQPHSRQTSRTNAHFRTGSGAMNNPTSPPARNVMSEKRKHALIKESEYGTLGLKIPIIEAAVKAEEIWGPALGSRNREESLKSVLVSMENNRELFESASAVDDCIRKGDYGTLVEEFGQVQKHAIQAKTLAERSHHESGKISDMEMQQILVTARVWMDVQDKTVQVKQTLWTKLMNSHPSSSPTAAKGDEHIELMSTLLQLGVDENPITAWLTSHQYHLQHKIASSFERSRIELEILRRKLSKNEKTTARSLANHLRTASKLDESELQDADTQQVLAFWEKLESSLEALLSTKTGVLGEVIEFWDTAQAFIDGKKQRSLPVGVDGQSRRHHRLSDEDVANLQRAPSTLFGLIREQLHGLFLEDPIDDVSSLLSPIPPTPVTPMTPATPSATTPSRLTKFNFKPEDIPPPLAIKGEPWEKLAFWPPYSNSLSASAFLGHILLIVASAAGEMASVSVFRQDEAQVSQMRILVSDIRERFNTATCAAWVTDSENCRELEDWTRPAEKPDVTNMPARFTTWESTMLSNLQKIVYIPDAAGGSAANSVIVPPSQRHVETVQRAFRNSLYKAFDGMMQFARKPIPTNGLHAASMLGLGLSSSDVTTITSSLATARTDSANTRKLLTISNLQHLRHSLVPTLITLFESNFSHTITPDARTLRDALSQMSSQVFKAYVKPTLQEIDTLITTGISDPHYTTPNARPDDAKPYIYSVLSVLVALHTEVSSATPNLGPQILSHCLEHISTTLVAAFTAKPAPFALPHLIQSTLDVEFLAQTLSSYTTAVVTDLQGKIYAVMDEKTDNDARVALQGELAGMRGTLKRLRDGNRTAYAGLKRPRARGGKEGGEGKDDQRGRTSEKRI